MHNSVSQEVPSQGAMYSDRNSLNMVLTAPVTDNFFFFFPSHSIFLTPHSLKSIIKLLVGGQRSGNQKAVKRVGEASPWRSNFWTATVAKEPDLCPDGTRFKAQQWYLGTAAVPC